MLIYSLVDVEQFPILESRTTARGPIVCEVTDSSQPALRIRVERVDTDPPDVDVVLALPVRAIDVRVPIAGKPRREGFEILLDLCGDTTGCRIWIEAGDVAGCELRYSFGAIDFSGLGTLTANLAHPEEAAAVSVGDRGDTILPIQFYRLGITLPNGCPRVDVSLRQLRAGDGVRIVPAGIA